MVIGVLKRILVAALALVAVSAAGFTPPAAAPPTTCVIGEAQARRAAYVPHALAARDYDARVIAVGFGSAAIGNWGSLGDALAVGGRLWLRSALRDSPRYYTALHNRYFRAQYFLYAPIDAQPSAEMTLRGGDLSTIARARAVRNGALFAGYVRFARLETIAIARPPLRAYAVAAHVPRYYTEPLERHTDVWAYVVGAIAPTPMLRARVAIDAADLNAHALILRDAPDLGAAARADRVIALGRVVAATSPIAHGALAFYSLRDLRVCEPRLQQSAEIGPRSS